MSGEAPPLPALDNSMGVLLIGTMVAMGLCGANCVQVYNYYNVFTKDPIWLKLLVFFVWALDTTHQGLITHSIYTYLITEYGNPLFLGTIVDTLLIEVLINACVVFLVQAFFTFRVWKLSQRNVVLVVILLLLVLSSFILSIVYVVKALRLKVFVRLVEIYALNRSINVISAVSDVAITASLVWFLQSSRTGFRRSDNIINRLILFSLNTGLLTGLDAIAALIANTASPDTLIYVLFYVLTSRLYSNSLMATLNCRKGLNGVDETSEQGISYASSEGRFRSQPVELSVPSGGKGNALSIKVRTERQVVHDQDGNIKHGADSDTDSPYHYGDAKTGAYPMHSMAV
ncbi:uncharacterized protein FOMMEDRAFT_23365 [Fomitiporia mediterranea MF3/22]|uniref:uncharacterized protein n=1 Tax=Fomitiporia mediterranea (strain MF3/22) TaxID=694068 RepID=UPI0004409820|nr:uncharacterized protein FOMMEDRAFT_23365 [Fomitiporia mediterranea MF3/22]EJC99017.1 hypothetical protein FOMMEDRAFT_23365 [Fomitiporia mediterranea MF3/22]